MFDNKKNKITLIPIDMKKSSLIYEIYLFLKHFL